jgi:hypothetical protein
MPNGWEEKARELKAFTRTRKLKPVSDLLRLADFVCMLPKSIVEKVNDAIRQMLDIS